MSILASLLTPLKPWKLELTFLLASLGSLIGIVVLLIIYDGTAVSDWPRIITLNTAVSMLSVAAKGCLIFSVAECIGQWKWIVFTRGKRQLIDFEHTDAASREPLGSPFLIWRKQTPYLLRLGVVIMILSLAIDPFSQQMVRQMDKTWYFEEYNGAEATTKRVTNYSLGHVYEAKYTKSTANESSVYDVIHMAGSPHESMKAAIMSGLSLPKNIILKQAELECPSENCTWPEVDTLGVCHKCNDLTEELELADNFGPFFEELHFYQLGNLSGRYWDGYEEDVKDAIKEHNYTAWTLPNGHFLANINNCSTAYDSTRSCTTSVYLPDSIFKMTSFGTGNPNKTNTFSDIDTLIWASSVVFADEHEFRRLYWEWSDDHDESDYDYDDEKLIAARPWYYWPNVPLKATECALYYCVKSITSAVDGNVIREEAREDTDARRLPESFRSDGYWSDRLAPENVPDEDITDSLEFHSLYSHESRPDLQIYYPSERNEEDVYSVGEYAVKAISAFFQDTLKADRLVNDGMRKAAREALDIPNAAVYNGAIRGFDEIVPYAIRGFLPEYPDSEDLTNATYIFEKLAIAMTNDMRYNQPWNKYDPYSNIINGQIHVVAAAWRVEWYWIALHGVVFIGGCVFVLATIFAESDKAEPVPAWKNSALATMSQGATMGQVIDGVRTVEEMKTLATVEAVTVRQGGSNEDALEMPEIMQAGGTDADQSSVSPGFSHRNSGSTLCEGRADGEGA